MSTGGSIDPFEDFSDVVKEIPMGWTKKRAKRFMLP